MLATTPVLHRLSVLLGASPQDVQAENIFWQSEAEAKSICILQEQLQGGGCGPWSQQRHLSCHMHSLTLLNLLKAAPKMSTLPIPTSLNRSSFLMLFLLKHKSLSFPSKLALLVFHSGSIMLLAKMTLCNKPEIHMSHHIFCRTTLTNKMSESEGDCRNGQQA